MRNPCRNVIAIAAAVAALSGCANYTTEQFFDRSAASPSPSPSPSSAEVSDHEMATVYFLRQRAWAQSIIYVPIGPLYYGINDQMLAIMPLGSFVRLTLPAGRHTFSRMILTSGLVSSVVRDDVAMTIEAGKTYYVGVTNSFPTASFGPIDSPKGTELVKEGEPAKIIHNPVSIATFTSRVMAARSSGTETKPPQPPSGSPLGQPSSNIADALPSQQQVNSFLEGLAAVALIGLTILAVAGAARNSGSSATPLALSLQQDTVSRVAPPPQAATQQRPAVQLWQSDSKPTWQNSSGTLSDILTSGQRVTVVNRSSGISYEVEEGRIRGSDGSRYTVIGRNIHSDSGKSYQVIGNSLWSSDGRSCTKTGAIVSCR